MKHSYKITIILLAIFFISQYIGLAVVNQYIDNQETIITDDGSTITTTNFSDLPLGERPEFNPQTAYIPILIAVLIGTALLLGIIKFGAMRLWKLWFVLALFVTFTTSIAAFTTTLVAIIVGLALTVWRIFKNNPIIHNATEPLVYAGIAAIFVPMFNLWSMSILLILISLYDAYAVWQSKHMVKLAVAQKDAGIFAGLQIPHQWKQKESKLKSSKHNDSNKQVSKKASVTSFKHKKLKSKKIKNRSAILGGGDIAFPLLLAGVLLKDFSLTAALILPIFTTVSLAILFYYSKKGKFYPAMPFISAGCFVGLGFLWLVRLL
tara:strand:- start:986 stop:1948 length:963 start_codon:yes stop_codon:yes gene_type:complete